MDCFINLIGINHMPIYRQQKKYARLGVKLSESTLGNWLAESIKLLAYLHVELVAIS